MPKWEYQGWEIEWSEGQSIVVTINDEFIEPARPLYRALNEAGTEGWELVAAPPEQGEPLYTLFLKRQIPD